LAGFEESNSAVTPDGWRRIVDAHKTDGKHYIVKSDEALSAFLALEANPVKAAVQLARQPRVI
jgi:hypothetical protein